MNDNEVFEFTLEILEVLAEDGPEEAAHLAELYDEDELRQIALHLANAYLNRTQRTIAAQEAIQAAHEAALVVYGPHSDVALAISTIDEILTAIL